MSSGRVLGSRLEGHGIDPRPMLDGSGVKAMPELIPETNPGPFNIRKEGKHRQPNGAHLKIYFFKVDITDRNEEPTLLVHCSY